MSSLGMCPHRVRSQPKPRISDPRAGSSAAHPEPVALSTGSKYIREDQTLCGLWPCQDFLCLLCMVWTFWGGATLKQHHLQPLPLGRQKHGDRVGEEFTFLSQISFSQECRESCYYPQLWIMLKLFLWSCDSLLPQPGMVVHRCYPRSWGIKLGS